MKFFSFNKNQGAVLMTFLFVILCGALYFFIYIPQNEKRLQEQRFRTLQNVHNNIQAKISNSVAMMQNLIKGNADSAYITYLNQQSAGRFSISTPKGTTTTVNDTAYHININQASREITIRVSAMGGKTGKAASQMQMKMTFDQFIHSLLPHNIFDEYIVFSDGIVAYETFPSGIDYVKDSLLGRRSGIAGSTVKSLNVSGNDYKIFLQPVNFGVSNRWVVSGLLTNSRYQSEKNQLPSNIVMLLLTAVLVMILAFPWIKLYQMGSKDRLTVSDGIGSIVVAMLLMSFLFLSFTKYNYYLRPDDSPDAKKNLANNITSAFKQELYQAYEKLYKIDTLVAKHNQLFRNLTHLGSDSFTTKAKADTLLLKQVDSLLQNVQVNQILWLDEKGNETRNWLAGKLNAPLGNFSHREYFKRINEGKFQFAFNDSRKPFFLDQIVSYTSGKFTSVLSIPSSIKGQRVAALSFDLKSVSKPLLTTGYQFAIIERSGKVLYHSDSTRNINENVMVELAEGDNLQSCMQAGTTDIFVSKYFTKNYNIRAAPMIGLPYYILIFADTEFKETRDIEIYSFTFAMMLILFLLLIVQLFVVFFVSARRSFFRKQVFNTSWIGPRISLTSEYNVAALGNIVLIILLMFTFPRSTFLQYMFILLFSVTVLSLLLNILYARNYKQRGQFDNLRYKNGSIISLLVYVVLINLAAAYFLELGNYGWFVVYQLVTVGIGAILYFFGNGILVRSRKYILSKTKRKWYGNWNYAKSFSLMAFTRLIITSGIPIMFFYISAYNFEQNINVRFRHLQFANRLLEERLYMASDSTILSQGRVHPFYVDSAWINSLKISTLPNVEDYNKEERITTKVLSFFRLFFTDLAVNEHQLYTTHAADSTVFYNPLLKEAIVQGNATSTYKATDDAGTYIRLNAYPLNYILPSLKPKEFTKGSIYWLLMLAILVAFFFAIHNIITRLFSLRIPDLTAWKKLDDKILQNDLINRLLFIIGLPGSSKMEYVKEKMKDGTLLYEGKHYRFDENDPEASDVLFADLINIPDDGEKPEDNKEWVKLCDDILNTSKKLVILNHFEYNIQSAKTNRIKLNLLEQLMLKNKSRIVILSTIHPVAFLDSVSEPGVSATKDVPGQDLERWHVLLGHYRIIVLPLEPAILQNNEPIYRAVYKETQVTHFLQRMQQAALETAKGISAHRGGSSADELAFKLQVTSHYFYMYIWQSLTKEEKFLLYDLAEDNLVNAFDHYNLSLLVAKGVILRQDGTLTIFNRGFRNFILTAIGNGEAMKIKKHIQENGNWSRLKNPLVIIIVALLTFLLASQQETYSRLITFVAALGAGVPAVLKIFSLFEPGQKKE